jgi:hypothetical protein
MHSNPALSKTSSQHSTTTYLAQTASRSASSPCAPLHCRPRPPHQQCKSSLPPRRAPGCNGCRMPDSIKSRSAYTLRFLLPSSRRVSHENTHVKPSLQLAVSPQLHKHHLVQRQADQIERLVDRVGAGAGFFGRSHSASLWARGRVCVWECYLWVVVAMRCVSADVLARLSTTL